MNMKNAIKTQIINPCDSQNLNRNSGIHNTRRRKADISNRIANVDIGRRNGHDKAKRNY